MEGRPRRGGSASSGRAAGGCCCCCGASGPGWLSSSHCRGPGGGTEGRGRGGEEDARRCLTPGQGGHPSGPPGGGLLGLGWALRGRTLLSPPGVHGDGEWRSSGTHTGSHAYVNKALQRDEDRKSVV